MRRELELNQSVGRMMRRFKRMQFKQYFLGWSERTA
eukprot:SAG31_NODE_46166_length_255_cov_1.314103_1_plen_35_part_01